MKRVHSGAVAASSQSLDALIAAYCSRHTLPIRSGNPLWGRCASGQLTMTDRENNRTIGLRRHPVVLTQPFVVTLSGLIVAAIISGVPRAQTSILMILVWSAWGILLIRLIWKIVGWREFENPSSVTPESMTLISGILSRETSVTPMAKVTDISLQESLLGRLLGYGKLILVLEGGDQPSHVIDHVPYSDRLFLELYSWISSFDKN